MRTNRFFLSVLFVALLASCAFAQELQNESRQYDVQEVRNVVYKVVDGRELKLNLFLPTKDGETINNVPVLIDIVSGGWGEAAILETAVFGGPAVALNPVTPSLV